MHKTFVLTLRGERWRCRLLPPRPPWWQALMPPQGRLSGRRLAVWPYVLQALHIPCRLTRGNRPVLVVPVFLAGLAAGHLREFEREEKFPAHPPKLPADRPRAWLAGLVLVPLLCLLHALRCWPPLGDAAAALGLPATRAAWLDLFGLDNVRMVLFHEWSRSGTALFLHADLDHLVSNAAFTLLFTRLLAGRTGFGLAVFLTLWAGTLGNALTVPLRTGPVLSCGFSTALFAAIGSLSGYVSRHSRPQALLPLAAGAALLAMLGTGGERTDYVAHVCGLLTGMGAGFLAALAGERLPRLSAISRQILLLLLGLALPALCLVLRLQGA